MHARSWRELAKCRFAHFPSFFSVHFDTYMLKATTAIPLQATALPATPLQATTLPAIPLQGTTLPAIPLQATTLPAIPLQATTLQAYPMSPGPSSSRVSPAQLHPFPKAITQGKRRKNARKSEILSGSVSYRQEKVVEKIIVEKRSVPRSTTTSGRRGTQPVSCATSDDICNCRCVEKTTATHPLRTGSSVMNARHGGTKNAPITVPLDLSFVTIARRDFVIGLSYFNVLIFNSLLML